MSANALAVDAFYRRGPDDTLDATEFTTSPWDARAQHAGPPLALIARVVDDRFGTTMRVGRITLDIYGPIPKPGLRLETRVLRPGKRVELVEVRLRAGDRDAIVANVWRFAQLPAGSEPAAATAVPKAPVVPGPEARAAVEAGRTPYFKAFEWRGEHGSAGTLGPAKVWCRSDVALIENERRETRDTLLALADSANGISAELSMDTWLSIPSSVTLTLARDPAGDWVSLDAATLVGPDGRGVTTGLLGDAHGVVGNIVQALLISPR